MNGRLTPQRFSFFFPVWNKSILNGKNDLEAREKRRIPFGQGFSAKSFVCMSTGAEEPPLAD